jgi:hypothetical protein
MRREHEIDAKTEDNGSFDGSIEDSLCARNKFAIKAGGIDGGFRSEEELLGLLSPK